MSIHTVNVLKTFCYNDTMSFLKRQAPLSEKHAFIVLSILMCFSAAQVSLNTYIDSLYLTQAISATSSFEAMKAWADPDKMVGALYTLASLITLLAFFFVPKILRRFGNYKWTLGIMLTQVIVLLGLALFENAWLTIPLFITETALVSILGFNFDIFVERYSKDESTGTIHGVLKALTSLAWLLPPFFSGIIVENYGFPLVYLTGAAMLVPAIFMMMHYFSDFKDLHYDDGPIFLSSLKKTAFPDIPRIYWVNFFLQFFFAWMIIYAPLYFHNHLGMSYADFGMILTIALTAFVIFPSPEGILADRVLGEKEMLIIGFLLMGISALLIPYFSTIGVSLAWWGAILFVGRVGAATVETMADVYFFKQIDGKNASLVGYYRRARPAAYIAAPLLASLLLGFEIIELRELFYILAAVMFCAIFFPLQLKDTK